MSWRSSRTKRVARSCTIMYFSLLIDLWDLCTFELLDLVQTQMLCTFIFQTAGTILQRAFLNFLLTSFFKLQGGKELQGSCSAGKLLPQLIHIKVGRWQKYRVCRVL